MCRRGEPSGFRHVARQRKSWSAGCRQRRGVVCQWRMGAQGCSAPSRGDCAWYPIGDACVGPDRCDRYRARHETRPAVGRRAGCRVVACQLWAVVVRRPAVGRIPRGLRRFTSSCGHARLRCAGCIGLLRELISGQRACRAPAPSVRLCRYVRATHGDGDVSVHRC